MTFGEGEVEGSASVVVVVVDVGALLQQQRHDLLDPVAMIARHVMQRRPTFVVLLVHRGTFVSIHCPLFIRS